MSAAYEMVIGLEVHAELKTKSKIFCGCSTAFGAEPNTQCCPVCMGLPGALPVLNRQAVEYAVKAGLATHCEIARFSRQDRKNYFYPDLPKAYQISQYDLPLCEHGWLDIPSEKGEKRIGITRIHIEEDAGKLIHDEKHGTLIDLNRCGVPLIEIVSEPDIRSAAEAKEYLMKLRAILLTAGVSDCRMNEGSFRCDVNLSVRPAGEEKLGTRTEMKNLNSFQFVVKAIEYEYRRQVAALEEGEEIIQETRRYDPATGQTYTMRTKEDANDYRYFPDPDLPPIELTDEQIEAWKQELPEMPDERAKRYCGEYELSRAESAQLTAMPALCEVFDEAVRLGADAKSACNLALSELSRLLDEEGGLPVTARQLYDVVRMQAAGEINAGTAKKILRMLAEEGGEAERIVEREGLGQISDGKRLRAAIDDMLRENEDLVEAYRAGRTSVIKVMMGRLMTAMQGKANPVLLTKLLEEALKKL